MTACLALKPRTSLRCNRARRLGLLALLGALAPVLSWSGDARADGAFPNALNILTPEQLPNETLLATNFGLVISFDHDQTWLWSCEQPANSFATLYQMGPPPLNRLYAVSPTSLITTDDSSCTWNASASGAVDAFVDPTNPNRVLAVIAKSGDAGSVYTVAESADAGTTFPQLRYTAAAGDHITGVEIARSDPQTVYLTLTSGPTYVPKVAVSSNGGGSWTLHDLSSTLPAGTYSIRLVAVDPTHPEKLILRIGSGSGEALALSTNSGVSATTPLTFPGGVFTAFARMPSGSLIAGGVVGTTNVGYRSTDGGASFVPLPPVPFTFKAMSARGTTLYAALDNMTDLFAIETSPDEGMTWHPLMRFNQDVDGGAAGYIQAIQTCVMSYCQADCEMRSSAELFSGDVCSAAVMPHPFDGGAGGSSGTGTGGASGKGGTGGTGSGGRSTSDGGPTDARGGMPSGSGCGHCALGPEPTASPLSLLMAGVVLFGRRRPRR
jgi:MYXO-CTERM domain-containing protein